MFCSSRIARFSSCVLRLRALQVPFAISCQTYVYCNPRSVILIVMLLCICVALGCPLSLFGSLVPRVCFGFEFRPADLGGAELARKCRPACPGSVYWSSIPLQLHIYVPPYRRSHTPPPPTPTSPVSNVLVPNCHMNVYVNVYDVGLHRCLSLVSFPTFVRFSNSNRQIREA